MKVNSSEWEMVLEGGGIGDWGGGGETEQART